MRARARAPPASARGSRAQPSPAALRPGPERGGSREEPPAPDMVGHLHLQGMEGGPSERGREGLLDSPDSGLPPSPSPSPPLCAPDPGPPGPSAGGASSEPPAPGGAARAPPPPSPNPPALAMRPRLRPVFFGEGIEVNPEPAHEIRCNSEVRFGSERRFRDDVVYGQVPTVTAYSETIVAAPGCPWRSFRSQLTLEPRPRALRFGCTTFVFPRRARRSFRTTVRCSLGRARRRFCASVQLQPGAPGTPEIPAPEIPENPEIPETPEIPPPAPGAPEAPAPEIPETPGTPEIPETPEIPGIPETPEIPPPAPRAPGTPETPEIPAPEATSPPPEAPPPPEIPAPEAPPPPAP